ncbi:VOC family protein [Actinomyces sp.]|uniref:VOC family protein n=1 Tax=Actinomyces sp. TaxID=29317 RepID=UPI0034C67A5A
MAASAEFDFGNGELQLGAPLADFGLVPPPEGEEVCYSMGLYCPDVDAVVEAARQTGAVIREPATTFVSGDRYRYASRRDPFGVRWTVMTRVEDVSEAESARRIAAWAAQAGSAQD